MTLTVDLPEALALQLQAALPEEERNAFAVSAIAEALLLRQQEQEAPLLEALRAELDPDEDPERDSAECLAVVEAELEDINAPEKLLTLEEARHQWEAQKAARQMVAP